jgi:hypothetical protein
MIVMPGMAGYATGYGFIGNPYFHGDAPEWRLKDGDTVIECDESHPWAMPVHEAYAELHRQFEEDNAAFECEAARLDDLYESARYEAMLEAEWAPIEELYRIQDLLSV